MNFQQLTKMLLGVLLWIGVAGLYAQTPTYCPDKKIIVAWMDYKPYTFLDESGELIGLDVEFTTKLLDQLGCPYQFSEMVWGRAMQEIELGRLAHMIGQASITSKRKEFAYFSDTYRTESMRIAILKENKGKWALKKLTDFERYEMRIVTNATVWMGQEFEDLKSSPVFKRRVVHVEDMERRIKMLSTRRIDGVIGDPKAIFLRAEQLNLSDNLIFHDYPVNDGPVHFMLSQKVFTPEFVDRVNEIIHKHRLATDES